MQRIALPHHFFDYKFSKNSKIIAYKSSCEIYNG